MASAAELAIVLTCKDMASKQLEGFSKSLGGMGGAAKVATATLATVTAGAVAMSAGLVKSVSQAANFEQVISQVGAVSGATAPQLQMLSDLALKMGADTSFSASEAAQAMAELAKGGIQVGDMAKVLPGVLDLAAAGGIGLAQAATIATDSLAIFAKQGVTMDQVANAFAGAANISSISVQDMAEAMSYAGPVAASMGISMEDAAAAIALLGANGIKGSMAGTALRTILTSLAAPTDKAAGLIKDLGLQFFDANGKMKDMTGISDELKRALGGMSDAQRAATLETLFGKEGMAAAIALMGTGENSIASYTQKLRTAATAHATGVAMMDNFSGSLEALKGSVESASITIGLMLLPSLRELVDWATKAVNASIPFIKAWGPSLLTGIKSGIGQAVAIVQSFATAIMAVFHSLATGDFSNLFGPLLNAVQTAFGTDTAATVALFVSNLVTGLNLARDAVLTAKQAFAGDWVSADSIATPVRLVGEAFTFLGDTVRVVQGIIAQIPAPVLAAAAAFLALGPAVQVVAFALPVLIGALTGLGPIISLLTSTLPILATVIGAIGLPITLVIAAVAALALAWVTNFMGIRDATMPIVAEIVAFVTGTLIPGLQLLGDYITSTLVPQFMAGWAQIQAAVAQAVAVIGPAIQQMSAAAVAAFQAALPGIQAFIDGITQLGAAVLPIVEAVGSQIVAAIGPAMAALGAWAAEVIPQFAAAWSNVASIVGPIIGAMAALIGSTLSAIAGFIEAHSAQITAILTAAWSAMSNMIGAVLTVITGLISAALLAISGDWSGAWGRLVQTAQTAGQQFATAIQSAMDAIAGYIVLGMGAILSAVGAGLGQVLGLFQSLGGQIAGAMSSLAGMLFAAGQNAVMGLVNGLDSMLGAVRAKAAEIAHAAADAITGALGIHSPSTVMAEYGQNIVMGLVEGMDEKQQEAAKKAAEVASAIAKAVTDTLGALKALANFDFAKDSPTGEAMGWFMHLTESLIASMQAAAKAFDEKALEQTNKFADTVSKVGGSVKNAVDALLALGKADWANASPTGNAMGWFMHLVSSLVQNFVDAGENFEEDGLAGAERFAETVGKVTGVISGAVAGLQALSKFVAPAEEKVSIFMRSLADMMEKFGTWAGGFEEDGLQASTIFAEAVGKVVGILDNGVKGLMSLKDFVAPAEATVSAFLASLSDMMERFGTWAGGFEADGLAASATFAEAAGKVVGVIGPAVDGFAKLANLAAPSETAISQLAAGIRSVVQKFADMATMLDADGTKATGEFADAAGKALGAAKTGVELFAAMAGDKDKAGNNEPVGIPSAKAIDELMAGIRYVVGKFRDMATEMEDTGIKEMQAFAAAAGQVLASAKAGTELFKSMEKLAVPSEAAIDYLLGTIGSIITKIRQIAAGIGTEGLAEATAFATGSFNVISTLASGLKLFEELAKFKDIPAAKLEEMWKALEGALDFAHKLFLRAEAIKAEAASFADSMKEAARLFAEGMSIGNGMGGTPTLTAPTGIGGGGWDYSKGGGSGEKMTTVNINNPVLLGRETNIAQQLANLVTNQQDRQIGYTI